MAQINYDELPGRLMVVMQNLLTPDNSVIQQATQELRLLFKHRAMVMALATIISACPEVQIRQFAAVLMRRKITKQWKNLPSEFQASIKAAIFRMMEDEQEHIVRVALAQVCAAIAKRELPYSRWEEFYQNLNVCLKSGNVKDRELGTMVLSSVSASAAECMKPHFKGLFNIFSMLLEDTQSKMVPYYTIKGMTSLVTYIGSDEVPLFRALIPKVILVTKSLLVVDENQGCEAMELFDELVECEVSIIVPHIKEIVVFSLEVASNPNFGGNARIKALSFITCLGRMKKKTILKQKLVGPILKAIFPIMSAIPEDDEEEEIGEDAESSHPASFGAQVIDILALHLPPEKLVPPLMQMVRPALESQDPYHRKAALICIAVLAEGCADYIRNKHLEVMLQYICKGMEDESQVVHNAALFALGQFSEHLQPDISKYHSHILPLLFRYLGLASETADKDPAGITRTYYALEMFCENLGDELLPYLPALMEKLLHSLQTSKAVHTRELAISAIGATANAAKQNMCPYFQQIMEHLRVYLLASDMGLALVLKIQAVDTLGVLARTIGEENFKPLVEESIQLGLKLINEVNDPDLRRCTYGLFASISTVVKEEMAPHLDTIVKIMIDSLQSTEGVVTHFKEDENEMLQVFGEDDGEVDEEEDISIEGEDNEDDEDIEGYSVENAYLEEKEDTCNALGEIADNCSLAFLPHIDECFSEIMKLIEYPASNIRKAALCCMGSICRVLSRAQGTIDNGGEVFAKALEKVIPCFINVINTDSERTVVMATLETINEMLKEGSRSMVSEQSHVSSITSAIRNVLQLKTACQDEDDEEDYDEDPQQAEHDEMLIEYAGEIIPSLAKAMGGQAFGPYLAGALPLLVMKTKKSCTVAEKSFSIGTLSETIIAMEDCIQPFAGHLVPVFVQGMQEDDAEVRSNAVFGIGVLAEHGKETVFSHYPVLLSAISSLIAKEDDQRVIDNICGAVARLVLTNTEAVPVSQVLPRLVQLLPLKEDKEENNTVFRCIHHLYGTAHESIPPLIPQLLLVFAQVLGTTEINEVTQGLIIQIVQSVHNQNPDDFNKLLSSLPQDLASRLSAVACCSS
ncbi:importin-4-like [Anneissia japonica]|uniref:importin-4-like n=1 Tax=Anneissia japonica TaxID=1529436 RepID=UPI001425833A|nr:importin-4-like [Anneissia japonica]